MRPHTQREVDRERKPCKVERRLDGQALGREDLVDRERVPPELDVGRPDVIGRPRCPPALFVGTTRDRDRSAPESSAAAARPIRARIRRCSASRARDGRTRSCAPKRSFRRVAVRVDAHVREVVSHTGLEERAGRRGNRRVAGGCGLSRPSCTGALRTATIGARRVRASRRRARRPCDSFGDRVGRSVALQSSFAAPRSPHGASVGHSRREL